jgi:hypothetical protein
MLNQKIKNITRTVETKSNPKIVKDRQYQYPQYGFELTLAVIGTDWTGSCKFNYHTITASTAPDLKLKPLWTLEDMYLSQRKYHDINEILLKMA